LSNDDFVVGGAAQLTSQAEVNDPKFEFGLVVVLGQSQRGAEPDRKQGVSNGLAEDSRARWLGWWTAILGAVVSPTPVLVVASSCIVTIFAPATLVDVVSGISRLMVVDDAFSDRGSLVSSRCRLRMD
jgi:hypothetical protein